MNILRRSFPLPCSYWSFHCHHFMWSLETRGRQLVPGSRQQIRDTQKILSDCQKGRETEKERVRQRKRGRCSHWKWWVFFNLLFKSPFKSKPTVRYHLMLIRRAIIRKSTNNKCWRGCGENGTLLPCWWECKLVQPLWRTVWRFLKKLGLELPYNPAIPLLGMHTKETGSERDTCTPVFRAGLGHGSNLDAHQQTSG